MGVGCGAGVVEGVEGRDEGGRGVAAARRARAAAVVEGGEVVAVLRGGVGREGDVGLRCAAGEDVEGAVDGDFEVPTFAGVVDVGFGEAHDDLTCMLVRAVLV